MKWILIASLILALAALSFLIFETGGTTDNIRIAANSLMEEVNVITVRNTVQTWSLSAKKAEIYDGGIINMQTVRVSLPKEGILLDANSGIYNIDANSLSLKEGIRALSSDYIIKAGSMNFKAEEGKLTTEGRVFLEGRGINVEGSGLQADEEQKIKLRDVKAVFF